jgi:4-amino-4-deoxy-L-arabinose transferase-like glycosyltransferase
LVHSDETWLAGLSMAYMKARSIFVTEPFFDLMPRQAHAIKSLFHLIQIPFIRFFGYDLFSVRLISLLVGTLILVLIYIYLNRRFSNPVMNTLCLVVFSLNIQFVYASHFARQEILLFTLLILSYGLYRTSTLTPVKRILIMAIIIGIGIGIHPNAFIIAVMLFLVILSDGILHVIKYSLVLIYGLIVSFFAIFYTLISLIGNPNFFKDYWNYGATLGVDANLFMRFIHFIEFFIKLYTQNSGTYYLPDIRYILFLGSVLIFISIFILATSYRNHQKRNVTYFRDGLTLTFGFLLSLLIIGRYNPTSVLFIMFPLSILLFELLSTAYIKPRWSYGIILVFITINMSMNYHEFENVKLADYNHYEKELQNHLPKDAVVLGNLSSGFIFKDHVFYDIRNLAYLDDLTLETYLRDRKIDTIIYYESYDYIHRNPQWQILYGSDEGYYYTLLQILSDYGTSLHAFEDAYYGTRIIRYMGDYPWKVSVYHIDLPATDQK